MAFDQAPEELTQRAVGKKVREHVLPGAESVENDTEKETMVALHPFRLQEKQKEAMKKKLAKGENVEKTVNDTGITLYWNERDYIITFSRQPKEPLPKRELRERNFRMFYLPRGYGPDAAIEIFEWAIRLTKKVTDLNKIEDMFREHISPPSS